LELAKQVVEPVEADVPGALEGAHPVVDGFQRGSIHSVEAMTSLRTDENEPDGSQHAKMFRHLGLPEAKAIHEVAYSRLAGPQCAEEIASAGVGNSGEGIGGGPAESSERAGGLPTRRIDGSQTGRRDRLETMMVNALDFYGTWKLFDGLCDAAFYGKNREYALGNTPQQRFMGVWSDGVAVKELKITDKP